MACNAHHIPGPDAHQWWTSGFSALQQIKSSSAFLRGFGVSSFTSNTVFFQHEAAAAADSTRSGNGAIIEMNASKVRNWFPSRRLFGPSAEEGVRHVKMTRRETSSAREGVTGDQPPFLPVFTKSVHIAAPPEKHTLGFLNRQKRPK